MLKPSILARPARSVLAPLVALLLTLLASPLARAQCPEGWLPGEEPMGFDRGGITCSTLWDPDGPGPQPPVLVVGSSAGNWIPGLQSRAVATWDGSHWQALGDGLSSVYSLAVYNGELYAGGRFAINAPTSAAGIAKWNGTRWVPLTTGSGANNAVRALCVYNNELYLGGEFVSVDGSPYSRLVKWNGTQFSPVSTGANGTINTMLVSNNRLYIGGAFTQIGGVPALEIASWDGSTFSPLGAGVSGGQNTVLALAEFAGSLYAGGTFTFANGGSTSAKYIARWDGTAWNAIIQGAINGTPYQVNSLHVYQSRLYIGSGGNGSPESSALLNWDGATLALTADVNTGEVDNFAEFNGLLCILGTFTNAQGIDPKGFLTWDGAQLRAVGGALAGPVLALTNFNGQPVAGGTFVNAGSTVVNNVASFDGTAWQALGDGLSGTVRALTPFGDKLVAGGDFIHVGATGAGYVGYWDGVSWRDMPGLTASVHALAVSGGVLYAGGDFPWRVAKWDGLQWQPASTTTLDSPVWALIDFQGTLFAGGLFVGDETRSDLHYVTQLIGGKWEPAGPGFNFRVYCFTLHQDSLYAGGGFGSEHGSALLLPGVAQWTGHSWKAPGDVIDGPTGIVYALASYNGELFAGGDFSGTSTQTSKDIVRWNGSRWRSVGSGVGLGILSQEIDALVVHGNLLYAGGGFLTSDPLTPAPYIARWTSGGPALIITGQPADTTACLGGECVFGVDAGGDPALGYRWRKDGQFINDGHGITGATTPVLSISAVQAGDEGRYDCVIQSPCSQVLSHAAVLAIDPNCTVLCNPDINHDGVVDQGDVDALINSVAGGGCP